MLYRSQRPGLGGNLFTLYKFRTMTEDLDENGNLRPDGERLLGSGGCFALGASMSFPELLNVLRGDMSLVGPRPLLPEYLGRYDDQQKRRHEVRPGLTGLAQVRGRNADMGPETGPRCVVRRQPFDGRRYEDPRRHHGPHQEGDQCS